jgi:DNA-binding NtrC family response regulator
VIAATHRDLRFEVNARRFRPDLFYRLNVMRVAVPRLADRPEDIPALAAHFWRMFRPESAIPEDVVADFARQRWPGNVRELRNAVERIALVGREPSPTAPGTAASYAEAKEQASRAWEARWVRELLERSGHNVSLAARTARMARSHLRQLVQRYGLRRAGSDEPGAADDPDGPPDVRDERA